MYIGPKEWSSVFTRSVYTRPDKPRQVLVKYDGDEKAAVDFPHGNASKHVRNYVRTAKSVFATIKSKDGPAQAVYRSLVSAAGQDGTQPVTTVPRNTAQVRNTQATQRNQSRCGTVWFMSLW